MSSKQHLRLFVARVVAMAALATATGAAHAASPATQGAADWPAYNRTLAGDRYSPLTEVTAANVGQLTQRCAYTLPELASFQTGPLVIKGTMYFTTFEGSYAIDAATCQEKWSRHDKGPGPAGLAVNRGFAYLDGRLFRGTADAHVVALDPADGHVLWDHPLDVGGPGISVPMAPIAANGRVYVGNAGGDTAGVTGHVFALDAKDGHLIWRFDVVPEQGPARASWTNSKLPVSGGAFWTSFALDEAANVLYVPAGNPAPDFDSLDRTGENLYTDSVLAIDASSGKLLGYNQIVKHDTHDWDVDSAPTLVNTRGGRKIIASANKDGLLSILDRSAVHRSASGSASAAAIAADGGVPVIPLLSQTPTTTRENADVPLSRDNPVHFCPGMGGGTEWNGAAYSPQTDSLFVGAVDHCAHVQIAHEIAVPPTGQVWFGSTGAMAQMSDPPDMARGWLTAFNAENGQVRWKFKAPHPIVAGVTPTAGGVVFAADRGGDVYAFDQKDGRVLWQTTTGQSVGGGIVVYQAGGHELIGIASGLKALGAPSGGTDKSRLIIYALH